MIWLTQWQGQTSGVAKHVLKKGSTAPYSHCYDHALNLTCSDTVKASTVLRDVLDIWREKAKLINKSPIREAIFRNLKKSDNQETSSPGIRVLGPTRWKVKADALQCVMQSTVAVCEESME